MPRAAVNGIELDYEIEGPRDGVPLLLIMGLALQRTAWPQALLRGLTERGFRCITFDNRDVGLSTRFDDKPAPNILTLPWRSLLGLSHDLAYRLEDMARDSAALLDHLQVPNAHVVGISMGGMIAQRLALAAPQRVRSMTLMMTAARSFALPLPKPKVLRVLLTRPRGRIGVDQIVAYHLRLFGAIGSPAFQTPRDELIRRARASAERALPRAGMLRQLAAVLADGDRRPALAQLRIPTQVLHGGDDPFVPPAHGREVATAIPQASFEAIPGWGHDLPDALCESLASRIGAHARRSEPQR